MINSNSNSNSNSRHYFVRRNYLYRCLRFATEWKDALLNSLSKFKMMADGADPQMA